MRGKREARGLASAFLRITPAHAGKTPAARGCYPPRQDHPRACGENMRWKDFVDCLRGSPPRMRGKREARGLASAFLRITPAHAGKTC